MGAPYSPLPVSQTRIPIIKRKIIRKYYTKAICLSIKLITFGLDVVNPKSCKSNDQNQKTNKMNFYFPRFKRSHFSHITNRSAIIWLTTENVKNKADSQRVNVREGRARLLRTHYTPSSFCFLLLLFWHYLVSSRLLLLCSFLFLLLWTDCLLKAFNLRGEKNLLSDAQHKHITPAGHIDFYFAMCMCLRALVRVRLHVIDVFEVSPFEIKVK